MADHAKGRGRLSSIDLLPDDAEPDIAWAAEQLRERAMPQAAILKEFNARLADRGIAAVSKSAWGRYAIRKAIQFRRLDQVRTIAGDIAGALGTDGADEVTITVAEMLKTAIYEALEGETDAKAIMALSRALQSAVAAQRSSEEYRRRLAQRHDDKMRQAVDRAEDIGREAGMSAATLAKMRKEFLGMRPAASAA